MDAALRNEAVELTRDLLRIDTSNPPGNETPAAVFLKDFLESAGVECELVAKDPNRANLIGRIRGSGDGPTLAFLGHTDVVPADAQDWTHPPFDAHMDAEGMIWARGAADMKSETATRALAVAELARRGFKPRGDILFIAESDEEDGTESVGMEWLVKERPDIRADYSLNEGGGDRTVLADGRVVYPLNVGEKATLPVMLTALGEAGHASTPTAGANAVPRLAALILEIHAGRTPRRVLEPVRRMCELLGVSLDSGPDAAIAQLEALHPILALMAAPVFGTTIAPTRLYGSSARNVMPGRASVELDIRILPGTTPEEVDRELRAILGDRLPFELEFIEPPNGGTLSPAESPLFDAVQDWVGRQDPGAIVLPTISTGFTDSHYMRQSFGTIAYGFSPIRHTPQELYHHGVHNKDERIHRDDLALAVEFNLEMAERIGTLGR